MEYRFATKEDIDFLVEARLAFTFDMKGEKVDKSSTEYKALEKNCYVYFTRAIKENTCDVILAELNGEFVGSGIIFYYYSVPSSFNTEGKNAYITSIYVKPECRRRGIGSAIVDKLMDAAKERGYNIIMLNASEEGRRLYEKKGFTEIQNGMIFDGRK